MLVLAPTRLLVLVHLDLVVGDCLLQIGLIARRFLYVRLNDNIVRIRGSLLVRWRIY